MDKNEKASLGAFILLTALASEVTHETIWRAIYALLMFITYLFFIFNQESKE